MPKRDTFVADYEKINRQFELLNLLQNQSMRFEDLVKASRYSRKTVYYDLREMEKDHKVKRKEISHKNVVYTACATEFEYRLHEAFKILFDALAKKELIRDYMKKRAIWHARAVKSDRDYVREARRGFWIMNLVEVVNNLVIKYNHGDAIQRTNFSVGVYTRGKRRILLIHSPERKELDQIFESLD